jgi:putative transposase
MMEERGVSVDHLSISRWAVRFLPLIEKMARTDETYIKAKGIWRYRYRALDNQGKTVDFLLTTKRDMAAAKRYPADAELQILPSRPLSSRRR